MKDYILENLYDISINQHHMNRYIKIINHYIENTCETDYEKHHICPRSLCSELVADDNNIVCLPLRVHYLVHWMLAKMTNANKMWFAFNQMRRISGSSRLYYYARKYVTKALKEMDRPSMTLINRKKMSERTKNTVVVKDKDNNTFRVSCDDEKYLSGEYVYYRCGYTHTEETKAKMSKNGTSGRHQFHNPISGENRFFESIEDVPEGWVKGHSDENKLKNSEGVSKLKWYHNPVTLENIRLNPAESEIPEGYVSGRYYEINKGFEIANSMTNVVDLKNRVVTKVKEIKDYHAPTSGRNTEKTLIYIHDNNLFTSATTFVKYLHSKNIWIEYEHLTKYDTIQAFKVKKPRANKNKLITLFKEKNEGRGIDSLGISVYYLKNFNHKGENIIWT